MPWCPFDPAATCKTEIYVHIGRLVPRTHAAISRVSQGSVLIRGRHSDNPCQIVIVMRRPVLPGPSTSSSSRRPPSATSSACCESDRGDGRCAEEMGAPAAPGSRLRPEGSREEGGRRKGPGGSLYLADCPYVKFGCGMEGAPTSSRWGRGRGELLPGVPTGPGCGGGRAVPIRVRHRLGSRGLTRCHCARAP
jgi:hypothetical protein